MSAFPRRPWWPVWPATCRGLPLDERQSAAELEAVLQHHHNLQEKLADDMLNLARNLKNNSLAAQNIIKQDNQVTKWTETPSYCLYQCVFNLNSSYLPFMVLLTHCNRFFCRLSQIWPQVGSITPKKRPSLKTCLLHLMSRYFSSYL